MEQKEENKKLYQEKIIVDLEEKQEDQKEFERTLVPEDSYLLKFESIQPIQVPDFKNKEKKVTKLMISFSFVEPKEYEKKTISSLVTPTVFKAKRIGQNNSTLYIWFEKLGLLPAFEQEYNLVDGWNVETFSLFLSKNLSRYPIKAIIKTVKPNNPEKSPYSKVDSIIKFVEVK